MAPCRVGGVDVHVEVGMTPSRWGAAFRGSYYRVEAERVEDLPAVVTRAASRYLSVPEAEITLKWTGTCPVCLRDGRTLTKGWKVRSHGSKKTGQWPPQPCPGSGKPMYGL